MNLTVQKLLRSKIADIRWILTSEKRNTGGYDDGRGLRYHPMSLYIKLDDYAGGVRYLHWFEKHFPKDLGIPDFLFETAIVLFKTGQKPLAALKIFQTFCSNIYWLDCYFGKPLLALSIQHDSPPSLAEYTKHLIYNHLQPQLEDFTAWLKELMIDEQFNNRCNQYIDLLQHIAKAENNQTLGLLLKQAKEFRNGNVF